MLADLIGFVDDGGLGTPHGTQARRAARMLEHMRASSADELSDLSRVSTPAGESGSVDSGPQMPDFHFAVNAGTILTEPWTVILIRAYSKAFTLHFGRADEFLRREGPVLEQRGEACRESLRRCEECIRALWFLGKKSDMARRVADTMSRALRVLKVDGCPGGVVQPGYGAGTDGVPVSEYGISGSTLVV